MKSSSGADSGGTASPKSDGPCKSEGWETTYTYEIEQDDMMVVSGEGPILAAVLSDAWHYVAMYSQDGPLTLTAREVRSRRIDPRVPPAESEAS
jgi:hypothetical protein